MSGPHLKAKRLGGKRPPGLPEPFAHYATSMESGPLSWMKEIVFQGRLIKPLLPFATSPLCTYTIDFFFTFLLMVCGSKVAHLGPWCVVTKADVQLALHAQLALGGRKAVSTLLNE